MTKLEHIATSHKHPYSKEQVKHINAELVSTLEAHGGVGAIVPSVSQRAMFCHEIAIEGNAIIVVHNANQINTLYGLLNGKDMLGNAPRKLPTLDANSRTHGIPGKSVVVAYRHGDLRPFEFSDMHP